MIKQQMKLEEMKEFGSMIRNMREYRPTKTLAL